MFVDIQKFCIITFICILLWVGMYFVTGFEHLLKSATFLLPIIVNQTYILMNLNNFKKLLNIFMVMIFSFFLFTSIFGLLIIFFTEEDKYLYMSSSIYLNGIISISSSIFGVFMFEMKKRIDWG